MNLASFHWPAQIPRLHWMGRPCPRCHSIEFTSAVTEPFDRLPALFFLQPIRCVNCWRKYYSLRRAEPAHPSEEQLWGQPETSRER
jgi:hypothetical protein